MSACGYAFFGAGNSLFGTDAPFDARGGRDFIDGTIAAVDTLRITDNECMNVYEANARRLLIAVSSSTLCSPIWARCCSFTRLPASAGCARGVNAGDALEGYPMRLMGWARTVALAGGLVTLGGCAMVDAMKSDLQRAFPDGSVPQQNESAALPPASPAPDPEPEKKEEVATTARGAVSRSGPKPMSPRRLVGMTQDEARGLLGDPSAEHSDPPATVWTWRNDKCEIDVFFYMDLSDRNFRALTYEMRGASKRESTCLGELREEARRGRGAGR